MSDPSQTTAFRSTASNQLGLAHMIKTAPQSVCSTLLLAGLALSTAIDDLGYRASLLLTGLVTSFAISRLMLLLRHSKRTLDAYQKYHDRLIKRMVTRTMRCGVFNIGLSFTNNQDLRQWLQLEARATRERIVFLAHHNMLTGLANRFLFTQRLQEALADLPNTQKRSTRLPLESICPNNR